MKRLTFVSLMYAPLACGCASPSGDPFALESSSLMITKPFEQVLKEPTQLNTAGQPVDRIPNPTTGAFVVEIGDGGAGVRRDLFGPPHGPDFNR